MAQFTVIGLGRFGRSAALELMRLNHAVLGVDHDAKIVDHLADELSRVVIADATDKEALAELGLNQFDAVLVAIGEDVETALVCVVHLKSLGIKNIWVKANSHTQHLILNKIGVRRIIHPEEEMGIRTAQFISYPMINDYISLGSGDFIVEITASAQYEGQVLSALLDHEKEHVEVLLIKRKAQITTRPDPNFMLQSGDLVVVFGHFQDLRNIAPKLK